MVLGPVLNKVELGIEPLLFTFFSHFWVLQLFFPFFASILKADHCLSNASQVGLSWYGWRLRLTVVCDRLCQVLPPCLIFLPTCLALVCLLVCLCLPSFSVLERLSALSLLASGPMTLLAPFGEMQCYKKVSGPSVQGIY